MEMSSPCLAHKDAKVVENQNVALFGRRTIRSLILLFHLHLLSSFFRIARAPQKRQEQQLATGRVRPMADKCKCMIKYVIR